jgi:hypothetical protein
LDFAIWNFAIWDFAFRPLSRSLALARFSTIIDHRIHRSPHPWCGSDPWCRSDHFHDLRRDGFVRFGPAFDRHSVPALARACLSSALDDFATLARLLQISNTFFAFPSPIDAAVQHI